jgi:hypothetical protein
MYKSRKGLPVFLFCYGITAQGKQMLLYSSLEAQHRYNKSSSPDFV